MTHDPRAKHVESTEDCDYYDPEEDRRSPFYSEPPQKGAIQPFILFFLTSCIGEFHVFPSLISWDRVQLNLWAI